jgi:NADPH-dependent 2,4-dienoyl-CoA reductase/sulfur reductase-like enzyme
VTRDVDRRKLLKAAAASVAAAAFPAPSIAQGLGAHVVVIGGGFGGASCARSLRKAGPELRVTLIEANETYTAMPHSNTLLAGLVDLKAQQFGYGQLKADGINVIFAQASTVDPGRRAIKLSGGETLNYERLVISPGIEFRADAIAGYDAAARVKMPPAYNSGEEVALLRRQLEAMEDGGTVVISSPVNPARCPPAPYERASLIAYYLKQSKPRSKVIVLDSKESFTMQKLFEGAWQQLYPGLIEWIGLSQGGELTEVDVRDMTLSTDFDKVKAAVANVIPPQKAGRAAEIGGVADRTGWCPVDPVTFASRQQPNIHVIGDAAIAGAMPRSASAAHSQAQICATAIAAQLDGKSPELPTLSSSCFSLIGPDYAISQKGTYRPVDGQYAEAGGGVILSPQKAPREERLAEAREAEAWFRSIAGSAFG